MDTKEISTISTLQQMIKGIAFQLKSYFVLQFNCQLFQLLYIHCFFSILWHVDGSYPSESGTNSLLRIHRKCFEHFLMSLIFCFWHADCFLFTVAFSIMNIYSIQSLPTETYNWCVREKNHKKINIAELFKTACTTIHQGIRKLNFHTHWFPHSGFQ